ncbi:nucleotidyltransferase domain-containing protein [Phenylobacterium sp.]|uniref:nucleotidyltransferase domain-containing protein n=1 Tax=Phenylobacterium sp. TaxID=1871053 RepID=UPI0030F405B5
MHDVDFIRERDETLAALAAFAEHDPRIEGLWLQGSLARGDADPLSDIDAYLVVSDAALTEVFAAREAIVSDLRPILAWSDGTTPGLKCVHALLDGGVRLDLYFEAASAVGEPRPVADVRVDKTGLAARLNTDWRPPFAYIGRVLEVILRMTRQGGTWPLRTLRRGQWSTFAMIELDLVNAQLAQLMALQLDPGNFHQNPFSLSRRLTEAHRATLDSLTGEVLAGVAARDARALLTTHLKILDALVVEGRAACAALDVDYPITEAGDAKLRAFLERAWPA